MSEHKQHADPVPVLHCTKERQPKNDYVQRSARLGSRTARAQMRQRGQDE